MSADRLAAGGRLWLQRPGGEPESVPLAEATTLVGRGEHCDVRLEDEAVSWDHLEIRRHGGSLIACDLDSKNGTLLNGQPLARPTRVRHGDTLTVGASRLEIDHRAVGSQTATRARAPSAALTDEERAVAVALVAPLRDTSVFAPRPATRAEIAQVLNMAERTVQRRMVSLAAKVGVPASAGRERPRMVAARVLELGLDRPR
jgi:pSer/pThr/pTyr-binding forkhead associated (FHA) protein